MINIFYLNPNDCAIFKLDRNILSAIVTICHNLLLSITKTKMLDFIFIHCYATKYLNQQQFANQR